MEKKLECRRRWWRRVHISVRVVNVQLVGKRVIVGIGCHDGGAHGHTTAGVLRYAPGVVPCGSKAGGAVLWVFDETVIIV